MFYTGAVQSSGVLVFGASNATLCHQFTPTDDSSVGNDVNLVIGLVSADRAVATTGGLSTIIIRDDDSKCWNLTYIVSHQGVTSKALHTL